MDALSEAGSFSDGGLTGLASRYATSQGEVSADSQFGPFKTAVSVQHGIGGYTDLAGQRLPLSSLEVLCARIDAGLLLAAPTGPSPAIVLRRPESFGGKSAAVVELNRGAAGLYDYLINAETGELLAVRTRRNGKVTVESYSDWRVVDGVRMPFHVHISGTAGLGALQNDTTDFNVATVELNGEPPVHALAPLPNREVVSFAGGGASSGWIPFQSIDHAIFLQMTLNGQPVRALLDSGASQTAIDMKFARTHGIAAVGAFMTGGQGGTISTAYAPGLAVKIGDLRLNGLVANLIDFDQPGTRMSPPLIAILGAEVFAEAAVDIDYASHRLRFVRPSSASKPDHSVTLPLGLFEGSYEFPVAVEGQPPIPVLLDTGNEGTFQIFPAYWQPHNMLKSRPFKLSGNGGVGGPVSYRVAMIKEIELGRSHIPNVETVFEMPGNGVNNETGILGNFGDALLERFHVVVNFPRREISFGQLRH